MAHRSAGRVRAALVALASLVFLASGTATAQRNIGVQPQAGAPAASAIYGDSWAVVIGINDYRNERVPKLRYAVADAQAVQKALLAQGFRSERITMLTEGRATKARIEEALGDRLRQQAGKNDRVLVFFAGHGMTVKLRTGEDEGYLIPVDGDPSRLFSTAISMSALRQISDLIPAKHVLYVVDACYSGYAVFNRAVPDDLIDEMTKKPAIQILTAGRQGDLAQEKAGHGVFTDVLLRGLGGEAFAGRGWVALDQLGAWVRERVYAESNKKQVPQYGNLSGDGQFVFTRPGARGAATTATPAPPPVPQVTKEVVREFGSLAIRGRLPGIEVWLDERRLGETEGGTALVMSKVAAGTYTVKARKAGYRDWERSVEVPVNKRVDLVIDLEALGPSKTVKADDGAEMVLVPAGEFLMGSDVAEDEKPPHRVYLDAFYIDKYEVTNALYKRFMEATGRSAPAYWTEANLNGATQPVVGVSWNDATAYCQWAGKRLPTEAEWEKAARGTDRREYPWGAQWDASRANSRENRLGKAAPVGSYPGGVSPYGAHDMAGNVFEWVADWYAKDYYKQSAERNPKGPDSGSSSIRVLRGGSWYLSTRYLRTASRGTNAPGNRDDYIGFRCARAGS